MSDGGGIGNGVRERFPNLTHSGVSYRRSIPRQEPVQVAEPFTEFWAKGTGASKIGNRSKTPFPFADPVSEFLGLPAGFFLTRSRGERGGRRIGFSPRTPRLRVRLCIPVIHGDRSPSSLAPWHWPRGTGRGVPAVESACHGLWRLSVMFVEVALSEKSPYLGGAWVRLGSLSLVSSLL